jgi:hypothetical protein
MGGEGCNVTLRRRRDPMKGTSRLFFYPAHQTNVRQQVREGNHRANDQERRGRRGAAREIYLSEA